MSLQSLNSAVTLRFR